MKRTARLQVALVASLAFAFISHASASDYKWIGSTAGGGSDWGTSSNWSGSAPTAGGTLTGSDLYVGYGFATNAPLVYSLSQGTTVFVSSNRGIVVGSGTATGVSYSGTVSITGGVLETMATNGDIVGNSGGSGVLSIDGGTYIAGSSTGTLYVGYTSYGTGTFNVNSGTAAITKALTIGNAAATVGSVNLNGGLLSVGSIAGGSGLSTFNFNGGTLSASASFTMSGLTSVYVKNGGANIDTAGNKVTISNALLTDTTSTGGGLAKWGAGTLTLSGANTYTGATYVNAGTLYVSSTGSLASSSVLVANAGASFSGSEAVYKKNLVASIGAMLSTDNGGLGTTGTIVNTSSSAADYAMSWRSRATSSVTVYSSTGAQLGTNAENATLLSDVLELTTTSASSTISLTYDSSLYSGTDIYVAYSSDGSNWHELASSTHDAGASVATATSTLSGTYFYAVVPEPSTLALLVGAFMGLVAYAWRKR